MNNEQQQNDVTTETDVAPTEDLDQSLEVADTEDTATASNADSAADDSGDYDSLTKEFEQAFNDASSGSPAEEGQSSESQEPQKDPVGERVEQLNYRNELDRVNAFIEQETQRKNAEALDNAVNMAKEASPELGLLSDELVRSVLIGRANSDPRFMKAFVNRDLDKGLYEKIVKAAAKDLGKGIKGAPDRAATQGREAVRQAANSQPGAEGAGEYSDEQIAAMPTAQFEKLKRQGAFGA